MDDKLNDFNTRFDLFRVQFQLGRMETAEKWNQKKKEIADKLHQMKAKLKIGGKELEDKWDDFSSEISEDWKRIRNIK